jgi:hypothetical protein
MIIGILVLHVVLVGNFRVEIPWICFYLWILIEFYQFFNENPRLFSVCILEKFNVNVNIIVIICLKKDEIVIMLEIFESFI